MATDVGNADDPSATPAKVTLRSRMNIPETWQYEKTSDDGKVRLSVDARIEVPKVTKAAVYKAKVAPITIEQVKKAHQLLMGGAQLCEPDSVLTREYWQQQILQTQKDIADAKDDADKEHAKSMENYLAQAQEQLARTPEQLQNKPLELAFRQEDGAMVLHGTAVVNGRAMAMYSSYAANFTQLNIGLTAGDNPQFPMIYQPQWDMETPRGVKMTREQAQQQAEQWMVQLDPDLRVAEMFPGSGNNGEDNQIWIAIFTRTYDGMPSLDLHHYISLENDEGSIPDYEKVEMGLDDSGFVCLNWSVPLAVTGTINQDAALLDFPQVQDAAEKAAIRYGQGRIKAVQKNPSLKKVKSCSIKIESLVLGLTRVAQKDKPGEFLLVPSWDVYGYEALDGVDQQKGYKPIAFRLTTINAIDGSIIDTTKGY